jgi:hypothetical protein
LALALFKRRMAFAVKLDEIKSTQLCASARAVTSDQTEHRQAPVVGDDGFAVYDTGALI